MEKLQASSVQIPGLANRTVVPSTDFSTRAAGSRNHTRREHRTAGYTFVEMMMALAIVAVLAAVAIPSYSSYREKLRIHKTIEEIHAMEASIGSYELLNGQLPRSLTDIGWGIRRDPWGNPYRYLRIQDSNDVKGAGKGLGDQRRDRNMNPVNTDYDLYSMGADGKTTTQFTAARARDDVVRANNGEYVGLASEH